MYGFSYDSLIVTGMKPCVQCLLEVQGEEIGGWVR